VYAWKKSFIGAHVGNRKKARLLRCWRKKQTH